MVGPSSAVVSWLTRWVSGLRFPWLLAVTASVFVVDLFVPDFIPLADEILLGLLTMIFASLKRRRGAPGDAAREIPDDGR